MTDYHEYTWRLVDGWQVLPSDHPDALPDKIGVCDLFTQRGYSRWEDDAAAIGSMEIWTSSDHPRFPYFCFVSLPGDRCLTVWIADDLTMLEFYRVYGQVGELGRMRTQLEYIGEVAQKLFRAQHGHDPSGMCRECDPFAYEQWQKRRAEARARKVAATQQGATP